MGIIRGTNHHHGGVAFHDPAYDHSQHNDGISASHDVYYINNLTPETMCSPAGLWEFSDPYWRDPSTAFYYQNQNGGSFARPFVPWTCPYIELPPEVGMIFAEVEAAVIVSPVEATGFNYLPGDVNMYNGIWQPQVLGSDVTYLVNYFRGSTSSHPCYLYNSGAASPYFWASADANGDCRIMGSDVTRLVAYFRGLGAIQWCSDYPPNWPPLPANPPTPWPDCQTPPAYPNGNINIVPTQPGK